MPRRRRAIVKYEESDPSDDDAGEQIDYEDMSSDPFGNISVHHSSINLEMKKRDVGEAGVDEGPEGTSAVYCADELPDLTLDPESDEEDDAPIEKPKEPSPRKNYQSVCPLIATCYSSTF